MKKNRIDQDIVVVLACSLVTIAAWVGFEIYRVFVVNKSEVKQITELQIKDLDPTLKVEVLNELEKRTP